MLADGIILYVGPEEVKNFDELPPIILDTNWLSVVLGRLGGQKPVVDSKVCPPAFRHVERVKLQDGTVKLTELAKLIASLETPVVTLLRVE